MIAATYALLLGTAVLFFYRLLRGPSLADRVVATDGLIFTGAAATVVHVLESAETGFLPLIIVFTLIGFISTSVIARFIEVQGR